MRLNANWYKQAPSSEGQTCSNSEQTTTPTVQNLNTPVQNSGDPPVAVQNFDTEEDTSKQIVILQEDMKEKESFPSVNLPSSEVMLSWLKDLHIPKSKNSDKVRQDLALLVPRVHSKDELKSLHTYAEKHIYGENKTVFLGNLAGSVEDWVKALDSVPDTASNPQENGLYETMNRGQAEAFALSLLSTFSGELIATDKTYPADETVWSTCLQYAPLEWVYFASETHYNNPSQWERGCIDTNLHSVVLLSDEPCRTQLRTGASRCPYGSSRLFERKLV